MGDVTQKQNMEVVVEAQAKSCHHTLHHKEQDGTLLGSWTETDGPYGIRVSCQICGKFYGYIPHLVRPDGQLLKAYLEQQRVQDSVRGLPLAEPP